MPNTVTIYRDADDRWPTGGTMRFCARQGGELLYVDVDARDWQRLVDESTLEDAMVALEQAASGKTRKPFEAGSGMLIKVHLRSEVNH